MWNEIPQALRNLSKNANSSKFDEAEQIQSLQTILRENMLGHLSLDIIDLSVPQGSQFSSSYAIRFSEQSSRHCPHT